MARDTLATLFNARHEPIALPIDFMLPRGAERLGPLERLFEPFDGNIAVVPHDHNAPYRL